MKQDPMDRLEDIIAETKGYLDEQEQKNKEDTQEEPKTEEEYSQWLYAKGNGAAAPTATAVKPARKKKRGKVWKILLIILGVFVGFCVVMWFCLARQPMAKEGTLGERKPGCSTILLAGTDAGGTRTDTMLLCHVNAGEKTMSLVSLPRDTYISEGYGVPKLNSVFGSGEDKKSGMEALMNKVQAVIGYRPDGYVLVDLDGFQDIVNAVGGIKFEVPQDMYYDDPTQDLHIALNAGMQRLNGRDAMGLVRYRSGYARADLQRVEVQRDFLKAALKQVLTLGNIPKAPRLLSVVLTHTTTDMNMANFVWLAKTMLDCDRENITMETILGEPRMINGGSYYVLFPHDSTAQLNEICNPYKEDILVENREIRGW